MFQEKNIYFLLKFLTWVLFKKLLNDFWLGIITECSIISEMALEVHMPFCAMYLYTVFSALKIIKSAYQSTAKHLKAFCLVVIKYSSKLSFFMWKQRGTVLLVWNSLNVNIMCKPNNCFKTICDSSKKFAL